jgi:hypothetical protein
MFGECEAAQRWLELQSPEELETSEVKRRQDSTDHYTARQKQDSKCVAWRKLGERKQPKSFKTFERFELFGTN